MKSNRVFAVTPQRAYKILEACCERAGLPKLAPHDLRRTCAKLMRDGGAPIERVSEALGHANISTTQTYLGSAVELRPGLAAGDYIKIGNRKGNYILDSRAGTMYH
jgi:integrase